MGVNGGNRLHALAEALYVRCKEDGTPWGRNLITGDPTQLRNQGGYVLELLPGRVLPPTDYGLRTSYQALVKWRSRTFPGSEKKCVGVARGEIYVRGVAVPRVLGLLEILDVKGEGVKHVSIYMCGNKAKITLYDEDGDDECVTCNVHELMAALGL